MRMSNRFALAAILAASCMNNGPAHVTLVGTGFAPELEGKPWKAAFVDVDGKKVDKTATGTIVGGKLSAEDVEIDSHVNYRADIFIDTDGDNTCQFGIDSVYAVQIGSLDGDGSKTASVDPTLVDSRGCLGWGGSTLEVTLSNFQASGTVFKAVVVREDGSKKIQLKTGSVSGGTLKLDFDGAIIGGKFYRVDLYIDNNSNDQCNPGGDAIFSKDSGALPAGSNTGLTGGTLPVAMDGDADTTTDCSSFQ